MSTPTPYPTQALAGPSWPAYLGAAACAVLAIAAGLPWIGDQLVRADGFDIPLAVLVSDAPAGGIGIGVVTVVLAGVALVVALLIPTARGLLTAFLSVGGVCTLLLAWYLIRVASLIPEGGSFGDAVSFGVWLSLLAAVTAAAAALLLATTAGRGGRG